MLSFDQRIGEVAARQRALVRRADVLRVGGTDDHVETRLRERRWTLVHAGVYIVGVGPLTWEQQVLAAVFACGPGACASHVTAARLYGLDGALERADIHLTMGQTNQVVPSAVHVFRSRRPLTRTRVFDALVPAVSVERCLIDYCAVSAVETCERAVESALDKGLTTEERLWEALAHQGGPGVPGAALLRKVLITRPKGRPAKSVLEIRLGRVFRQYAVQGLVRNHPVVVTDETFYLDYAHVGSRVAIEADSKQFHSTRSQRERDARRQAKLETAGWQFERIPGRDVFVSPAEVAERVRTAIAHRVSAGRRAS